MQVQPYPETAGVRAAKIPAVTHSKGAGSPKKKFKFFSFSQTSSAECFVSKSGSEVTRRQSSGTVRHTATRMLLRLCIDF